jgi:hypothetical protein
LHDKKVWGNHEIALFWTGEKAERKSALLLGFYLESKTRGISSWIGVSVEKACDKELVLRWKFDII